MSISSPFRSSSCPAHRYSMNRRRLIFLIGMAGLLSRPVVADSAPVSGAGVHRVNASSGAAPELYPVLLAQAKPDFLRPAVEQEVPWWTPLFKNIGYGVGGMGLVGAGVGAYYGLQAESKRNSVKRDTGLSQQEALSRHREANVLAGRANLFFIVGASVAALGASLVGFDWIAAPPREQLIVVSGPKACEANAECSSGETCQNKTCRLPPVVVQREAATYFIEGVVVDKVTGDPIRDASIRIGDAVSEITVNSGTGAFKSWPLPVGDGLVKLYVRAPGYRETTDVVSKEAAGKVKKVTLALESTDRPVTGEIRGVVQNGKTGKPMQAKVFVPVLSRQVETDNKGRFSLIVPPGEYDLLITVSKFVTQKKRIKVRAGDAVILNVDMSSETL